MYNTSVDTKLYNTSVDTKLYNISVDTKLYSVQITASLPINCTCCAQYLFTLNRVLYEMMCKNIAERGRPQTAVWRICIACQIPMATNTHSEYVMLTVFPFQQRLQERVSMLCYTYSDWFKLMCVYFQPR